MRTLPCCDCGTALLASTHDRAHKLSLCLPCWQKTPEAVLLSRSKAHDAGHAVTCRAAIALDHTHAVGERGPRTFNARGQVAKALDGIGGLRVEDVRWLERVAREVASAPSPTS